MTLRRILHTTSVSAASAVAVLVSQSARASGPLEYPDIGSASFSRGGAWLATATDPVAVHFNPAAIATQASGLSLELNMPFNNVCYVRTNPGDAPTGPSQGTNAAVSPNDVIYQKTCNEKAAAPRLIPALAIVARLSDKLGIGFAVVPPNAYGGGPGEWPTTAKALNQRTGQEIEAPAPYRYMTVGNRSTILMPTFALGYEVADNFRVGAGFVWGVSAIDVESFGVSSVNFADKGDHAIQDSKSRLTTEDLFMPGVVLGLHWSLSENIDVGAWGRWVDAVHAESGNVEVVSNYYNSNLEPAPICTIRPVSACTDSVPNEFGEDASDPANRGDFKEFHFVAIPPEARVGARFHLPRGGKPSTTESGMPVRDPLADDVFDVELNLSWTKASDGDEIRIRFIEQGGKGVHSVFPTPAKLPPRADRGTGYKDSYGLRFGGQYNLVPKVFGLRAGTWLETKAVEDDGWLNVNPIPGMRGGFGGGFVVRHGSLDISAGYQRHWNQGLDNHGNGLLHVGAGVVESGSDPRLIGGEFQLNEPGCRGDPACLEQQFRTYHAVNGGRVSQDANVFTVGAAYRF